MSVFKASREQKAVFKLLKLFKLLKAGRSYTDTTNIDIRKKNGTHSGFKK